MFADSRGDFVEGAVMASVPVNGSHVPVSVCGAKAKEAAELLNSHGMKFTYLSDDIGLASATKALRSVLAKGIIALVTETVFATDHYHITEEVLDKMKVTMFDERGFIGVLPLLRGLRRHPQWRFCHEMEEVLKTLDDLGENSIMTQATLKKFEWLQQEGYAAYFRSAPRPTMRCMAVKKMLDEQKRRKSKCLMWMQNFYGGAPAAQGAGGALPRPAGGQHRRQYEPYLLRGLRHPFHERQAHAGRGVHAAPALRR